MANILFTNAGGVTQAFSNISAVTFSTVEGSTATFKEGGGSGIADWLGGNNDQELLNANATAIYYLRKSACATNSKIYSVNLPNCSAIGASAFWYCQSLTTVSFENCKTIEYGAFSACSNLATISFPNCIVIGPQAFQNATANHSSTVNWTFPKCGFIEQSAFQNVTKLNYIGLDTCIYIQPTVFSYATNLTSANLPVCFWLGTSAFYYCIKLSSINIPLLRSIGSYAFAQNVSLTTNTFEHCKTIGVSAFYGTPITELNVPICSELQSAVAPAITKLTMGCPQNSTYLASILSYHKALQTIQFNTMSIMSISTTAFAQCSNLTSIYFPSSYVESVKLLTGWSDVASKIVSIPDANVNMVFPYQSRFVSSATSIPTADLSCRIIGALAYYNCRSIAGDVTFPNCIHVDDYAFQSTAITTINLPQCKVIDVGAFQYCYSLTAISLPTCAYIEKSAFIADRAIATINLPQCRYIGESAFAYISALTELSAPKCLSIASYAFTSCYSLKSINIENCFSLGSNAFYYCKSLTTISCPTLATVGSYAFAWTRLESIEFPNCITISSGAFAYDQSLSTVSLPACKTIGNAAFCFCPITSLYAPNCTTIEDEAFIENHLSNWDGINTNYFSIEQNCLLRRSTTPPTLFAFAGGGNVYNVSLSIPIQLGNRAFEFAYSLETVHLDQCNYITSSAFRYCAALTTVSIPTATTIADMAFYSNSRLTTVTAPLASRIFSSAFQYCYSLANVNIMSANFIGSYAFCRCSALSTISLPNCKWLGSSAFLGCENLSTMTLPVCSSLYADVFAGCSNLATLCMGSTAVATLATIYTLPYSTISTIAVPLDLLDSYKVATNWSFFASKIVAIETPINCKTLTITGDDCVGRATTTTIHASAICDIQNEITGEIIENQEHNFDAQSESFPQNTSTTETVTRTLSYTYFDKTATCQITQGVWVDQEYTLENVGSYGFAIDSTITNPNSTLYEGVYKSNNQGINSSYAVTKITFLGYETFTIYIRSNAESSYDYTIASTLDAASYPTSSSDSTAKSNTSGKQQSGTALSNYTKVEYATDGEEHFIYMVFRKDGSSHTSPDSGYFLIQKNE